MKLRLLAAAAAFVLALEATAPGSAADIFQATSAGFPEGGTIPSTYMFDAIGLDKTPCGGQNLSPPIAWTGAPAATTSFAVTAFDPDGFNGEGVSHWVAYDIPATVTSLSQGAAEAPKPPFTQGKQQYGAIGFRGFCPPKGQSVHHYLLQVFALDLPPTLAPGMTRAELFAAIKGHILRNTSVAGLLGR